MTDVSGDPIEAIGALAEPTRRRLYDLVAAADEPVGRDDAVAAMGISRELAAFHLDRLVDAGLLEATYRRRNGRTGPGAGRPAKFYRRADAVVELTLPTRRYSRAAELMATAIERLASASGLEALTQVARERGAAVAREARRADGPTGGRPRSVRALVEVLRGAGYEPRIAPDGSVCLRNCPYDALVADHRDVTCGMNLAWADGLVGGLGIHGVEVELDPEPGRCCVVIHPARPGNAPGG
jgi:predicted ArsR family transcriptional regulator